ncbi:hypothetical protein EDB85DRAFT_2279532 [Lactarius pseudohatsudake]|nr:hypothetical protein EDB85DRAFT_2279532 [Lactarius pseudohatsudake]
MFGRTSNRQANAHLRPSRVISETSSRVYKVRSISEVRSASKRRRRSPAGLGGVSVSGGGGKGFKSQPQLRCKWGGASWAAVSEEKAQLEAELKKRDKRILRLRHVTTEAPHSYSSRLRREEEEEEEEGACMQLVAQSEGGPQELRQLMRNWVEIKQSTPCFLASVTLEFYDK